MEYYEIEFSEIAQLLKSDNNDEIIREKVSGLHDKDLAQLIESLDSDLRLKLYDILGEKELSDPFSYLSEQEKLLGELPDEMAADIIENMDPGDAVDVLDQLPDEKKQDIINLLDKDAAEDVKLISAYDDDLIGSKMTTDMIKIKNTFTVKQAMTSLVEQAAENDNVSTIYVVDDDGKFYGAITLRDLFIARSTIPLDDIIVTSYPYLYATEEVSDCIDKVTQYAEDTLPVLDNNDRLIGVITSATIIETVEDELSEDYAKMAAITEENSIDEPILKSMGKRLPWLIILLGLGVLVSMVIGAFETVIVQLPLIVFFQALVLGMSGNTGTQSLGVTLRNLNGKSSKERLGLFLNESRISLINGAIAALIGFVIIGLYLIFLQHQSPVVAFSTSGCIAIALIVSMSLSGAMGTLIPMFFDRLKIDPAVASGPLITTINDLISACAYYGFAFLLLIHV